MINDILLSLSRVESYSRAKSYAGFCKFDALNSRFLEVFFGWSFLTRLLVTQVINRIPLPLRDLFRVRKERNPKGIANFLKGYVAEYRRTQDIQVLNRVRELADWLLEHHSKSYGAYQGNGLSWGYHFPWQSPGFLAPRHSPNCIVTVFCAEALLAAYQVTGENKYLSGCLGAAEFILKDLPVLEEGEDFKCIGYVPVGPRWKVININSVAAGFLAKLAKQTNHLELMKQSGKMINWVVQARQDDYSWNYTYPKSQSAIGPDNYHTGGILDGLFDYMVSSNDFTHKPVYLNALKFYEKNFFTQDWGPKWRVEKIFPLDIHGAAQGILTFTRASFFQSNFLEKAQKISSWAIQEMQDPQDGHFYYQRYSFFTWKIDLMRWGNSWMFWALSDLMLEISRQKSRPDFSGKALQSEFQPVFSKN